MPARFVDATARVLHIGQFLLCGLVLAACATTPVIEWQDLPNNILVASPAVTFKITGRGNVNEVALPADRSLFGIPGADRLVLYRIVGDKLERTPFQLINDRLVGNFVGGEKFLLHFPVDNFVLNKYDMFCRIGVIQGRLIATHPGIIDRICPRIMCPSDPFFADRLLDEFVELRQFPDSFNRNQLSGMRLGPAPQLGGFGNTCDQCFGRDWGTLIIPECRSGVEPSGVRPYEPKAKCWESNGPGPITQGSVENITNRQVVGAINAVAPHPTSVNVVYAGAVNGGIWRTSNATAANPHWQNLTDRADSLSIGALQFDPTDATDRTLVAGTGRFSSFSSQGGGRVGLLRTTDGFSWTTIDGGGTLRGLNISGVAPRGSTIVISADSADTFANRGVWRSIDTGSTWTQVSGLAGSGLPTGTAFGLASDPANASRLYTNAGGDGIFLSTDTGATWSKVSDAAMDGLFAAVDNVQIAVGTSNNVFVAIGNTFFVQGDIDSRSSRLVGIFRSGDGGVTWTALDLPATTENAGAVFGIHPGGGGHKFLSIAADPNDANVVYMGGDRQPCFTESDNCQLPDTPTFPNSIGANDFSGRLFRIDASLPAGSQAVPLTHSNTTSGSAPHADSRNMKVAANGDLIEADDGGIYRRTTPRLNSGNWFSMNGNIQTTEFHSIVWDSVGKIVIGGTQDNDTPEQTVRAGVTWRNVSSGDGGNVAVDDTGTPGLSVRYSSNQLLRQFRKRVFDSANVLQSERFPALEVIAPGNPLVPQVKTPIRLNNVNPIRMIIGAKNAVYESLDQGDTVTQILDEGITVNASGSSNPIAYGGTGNPDMVYVGSDINVFIRNGPEATTAFTRSVTYPGSTVVGIAIDPANPNTAFVADNASVFLTPDGGETWADITGNLGTLNVGTIRSLAFRGVRGAMVAVGTDVGVFRARGPDFNAWAELACGLPRVPVYSLDYDATDNVFVAGTLGRGAWVLAE